MFLVIEVPYTNRYFARWQNKSSWIPAFAGMTEVGWVISAPAEIPFKNSGFRRNDGDEEE